MLTSYIQAAMRHAKYEQLEDGTYAGYIPECPGVWTDADTLEDCRNELEEVLEGWIALGLRRGDQFQEIDGIELEPISELVDA
jgi:predicted RNase H-like HicB family nuclease